MIFFHCLVHFLCWPKIPKVRDQRRWRTPECSGQATQGSFSSRPLSGFIATLTKKTDTYHSEFNINHRFRTLLIGNTKIYGNHPAVQTNKPIELHFRLVSSFTLKVIVNDAPFDGRLTVMAPSSCPTRALIISNPWEVWCSNSKLSGRPLPLSL